MRLLWLFGLLSSVAVTLGWPEAWEAGYGAWRSPNTTSFGHWRSRIPPPVPHSPLPDGDADVRRAAFYDCLRSEALSLSRHVMAYQSPSLSDVREEVEKVLKIRGARVIMSVFWGRFRYVPILVPYLRRNLRAFGGIVDEILLIHKAREAREEVDGNIEYLQEVLEELGDFGVRAVPFCEPAFGCAFDDILNDPHTVYIKTDDDIMFIKDGSVEHLVLEVLINPDYGFYSGGVVNHPHLSAVYRFIGAMPVSSYHWQPMAREGPPFYDVKRVPVWYYGKTIYEQQGSPAHQSFVYNVANNRLDMYSFDLWNMNQCKCSEPQENLAMCDDKGYYRWSINAIAWTPNITNQFPHKIPSFDEPVIAMGWGGGVPPYRAGVVGEALFVHMQYVKQRHSPSNMGLDERVLLPFYTELAAQYTAAPYGGWQGNRSLLLWFDELNEALGEVRGSGQLNKLCHDAQMTLEKEMCDEPMP